jgi:predicted NBD/HSP70 family sugar kinase
MGVKNLLFKNQILKELYFANSLSCAELSLLINKSLPLTTKLVYELIDEGYVSEKGFAVSTGGRRPITFSLRADVQFIVSVALDQFVARIVIMDMHNNFVTPVEKFELPLQKNTEAANILADKINRVVKKSRIPLKKIIGVGIGMPGFVDAKKGINYSFLKTPGSTVTAILHEKTGLPVFIDNDSSLIALAEFRFGASKGKRNSMVVNIGWGVGLGMIIDGELFRGNNGFAGEFSHIPLFLNGKLCSCGKRGCLETETSLLTIIQKAKEGLKAGRVSILDASMLEHFEQASEMLITAAREGDQFAVELFSEAGYNIGRGVAILIHILNPEQIILSGRGSSAGKIWQAPIQQALNEHCIPRLATNTTIEMSSLGYNAELIGAAALVMDNYKNEITGKNFSEIGSGILSGN